MDEKNRILIIDDNDNECKTLKSILEAKGYQVFTANGSRDAINLVNDQKPHLILLDLIFKGGKNGIEIFKDIKNIVPDIKAILITGYGPEEERRLLPKAWEEGMIDEFLRKPVSPDELIKVIEKYTGGIKNA